MDPGRKVEELRDMLQELIAAGNSWRNSRRATEATRARRRANAVASDVLSLEQCLETNEPSSKGEFK